MCPRSRPGPLKSRVPPFLIESGSPQIGLRKSYAGLLDPLRHDRLPKISGLFMDLGREVM